MTEILNRRLRNDTRIHTTFYRYQVIKGPSKSKYIKSCISAIQGLYFEIGVIRIQSCSPGFPPSLSFLTNPAVSSYFTSQKFCVKIMLTLLENIN
jgi:hypothetical protein